MHTCNIKLENYHYKYVCIRSAMDPLCVKLFKKGMNNTLVRRF